MRLPVYQGQKVHTPNGQATVLWVHRDHQWEFGRLIQTRVWVHVQTASGIKRTFPLEDVRT